MERKAVIRLQRDLKELQENAANLPDVSAHPLEGNIFYWHANIRCPGTPFDSSHPLHLQIDFPRDYPHTPPRIRLMVDLDHPNVFGSFICLDLLKEYVTEPYTGTIGLF